MSSEFIITTLAIVLGPILAVWISQTLQSKYSAKQQKMFVFRALMTTRRTPLSPERVQALNLVEVEFSKDKQVKTKFKELIAIYNDTVRWQSDNEQVRQDVTRDVDEKTAELLKEMGAVLGFRGDSLELLKGGYYPSAFAEMESKQHEIRDFVVSLSRGDKAVPTAVVDMRHPKKILEQAKQSQLLLEFAEREEEKQ